MKILPAFLALTFCLIGIQSERPTVHFAPTGERREIHDVLKRELKAARKEILVAVYSFTSQELAKALVDASKRGIGVRVLMDADQAQSDLTRPIVDLFEQGRLSFAEVDAAKAAKSTNNRARFHHKFAVIDDRTVVTGSYNWTVQADEDNFENLVVIRDPSLAKEYRHHFEDVWKRTAKK